METVDDTGEKKTEDVHDQQEDVHDEEKFESNESAIESDSQTILANTLTKRDGKNPKYCYTSINQQEEEKLEEIEQSDDRIINFEDVHQETDFGKHENQDNEEVAGYIPPTFDVTPLLVHTSHFQSFTKGVKWAKDGNHFAVATDDNCVHVFQTVETLSRYEVPDTVTTQLSVIIREPQPINDFAWHPSHENSSCITTCGTQPLHLYEAATGKLISSYVAKNHLDELVSAYSVQFSKSGDKICAGYKKFVRIFETEYPGRWTEVSTWKQYQAGIVSAVDTDGENILAVGTYCNNVALYDLRNGKTAHEPIVGHSGGVTQVRISFDGTLFYSGARRDNVIQCRDLRKFSEVLREFPRVCSTNQRVQFDFPYEEDYLCSGNTDGTCYMWNLRQLQLYNENQCQPNLIFLPHTDLRKTKSSAANGISFHPWAPLLASSSGGRSTTVWDDEIEQCVWTKQSENAVKLWKFTG